MQTRRRSQRGQTALIALLVLLLLSFIGGLFVTIVASNLRTEGRSNRTLNADYYAEAGLRYADDQLRGSLDGADWRPPLQNLLADATAPANSTTDYRPQLIGPVGSPAFLRYIAYTKAQNLGYVAKNDPDKSYLEQGFTRYDTQGGRFLLRITYQPVSINPSQAATNDEVTRYLKIESVGRQGTVDPADPTTYNNAPPTRLAATLVAYKPIGITDYARFETNIDNRANTANLGVPSQNVSSNIVTPGVFDFDIASNGGGGNNLSLVQYPLITTLGGPDAYMKDANGNIFVNPEAGQGTTSGGTYTPVAPSPFTPVTGGGSIRSNMNLRLYGENKVYLNRDTTTSDLDDVEVAGNLLLDNYIPGQPLTTAQQAELLLLTGNPSAPTVTPQFPSNDPNFDTESGAVRDGATGNSASDAEGYPRDVARLAPPDITTLSSATRLNRYQAVTENSPPRLNRTQALPSDPYSGPPVLGPQADGTTPGMNGYGQAIYINNTNDVQPDSTTLVGGHTLMDEWLNGNGGGQSPNTTKGGWVGPFYNPPGAEIVFGPQQVTVGANTGNGKTGFLYGFHITRSDVDNNGNPVLWKDLDNDPTGNTALGPTMTVTYDELQASNKPGVDPSGLSGDSLAAYNTNANNDVVIYAEGNVRVRGAVSAFPDPHLANAEDGYPRHVTIVTNGTAYIDGNIVKGNPNSSITILARDYVCVNTTQFLAGAAGTYPGVSGGLLNFVQDADQFVQEFSFGVSPQTLSNQTQASGLGAPPSLALYVSGGAGTAGSAIADFDIADPLTPAPNPTLPASIWSGGNPFDAPIVGDVNAPAPTTAFFDGTFNSSIGTGPSLVIHGTYDLSQLPAATYGMLFTANPEQPFQLWVRKDAGVDNTGAVTVDQPFELERAAILPMDVHIEAVLYAQNKSFFVIPGPWFNSDSGDDVGTYAAEEQQAATIGYAARPGIDHTDIDQTRFPFYGQPIDLKITIIGSVSEARPAEIGDQASWMQKWGWIPKYHGSEPFNTTANSQKFELAGHVQTDANGKQIPAPGLTVIYDPQAGYPFDPGAYPSDPGAGSYLRTDIYGRPLPVTPKLPVSTGLIYAGQTPGQSLLQ